MNFVKTIRDHAKLKNVDENLLLSAVNKIRPGATLHYVVGGDVIDAAFSMLRTGAVHAPDNNYQKSISSQEVNQMANSTDPDSVERNARQTWDGSSALRSEFGQFSTYSAYCRYEAKKAHRLGLQKLNNDKHVDPDQLENEIRQEWDGSSALRSEFGQFSTYSAYRRAEVQGRVHITGNSN